MTDLPGSWIRASLGDLGVAAQPGFASGAHNRTGNGTLHLRPMNINRDGEITIADARFVDDETDRRVVVGDVLFNNTNSPDLVGKTAYIDLIKPAAYSNHMTRLRPPELIAPKFLALQLHWLWMSGYFKAVLSNHVNQASVPTKVLLKTSIVVPPLAEQRRIVATLENYLTRLGKVVTEVGRAAGRTLPLRLSVLYRLRAKALGLGAQLCEVGQVADTSLGKMLDSKKNSGEPTPYLRNSNVRWGSFDLSDVLTVPLSSDERQKFALRRGDLLVCEGGEPGRCAIWRSDGPLMAYQKALHRLRPREAVEVGWLAMMLEEVIRNGRAGSLLTGTTIKHLPQERLRAIKIPIPSRKLQRELVEAFVSATMIGERLDSNVKHGIAKAGHLRRSLLTDAFAGQLVPQEPNDEPASELLARSKAELAAERTPKQRRRAKKVAAAIAAPPVGTVVEGTQGELPI